MSDQLQNGQAPESQAAEEQQSAPVATPAPQEPTEETKDGDEQAAA
ncbi:hypothetical protein HY620_01910 [Candidatus Uhrbacteria bacterium]|nr:hypothetical protein [Candidatus Uhrbacteria bacterium]